eukprot:TRINITY_DN1575_c0_g1_i1.p1 TRINITY_DN1575_c0_g1~~TRINITY_DN1575_c0_g1_i1.p1  ORF type:complete len:464 (+),score=243.25 TRINITY_DN1575_c0_g1_i1:81-1394(+)
MGKNVEKTEDYAERTDKAIQDTQNAVAEGNLAAALDQLFLLEKNSRNAGDFKSTTRLAQHIVRLSLDSKNIKQVSDSLMLITKRRGQEKKVINAAVQVAMEALPGIENVDEKLELIKTLRSIAEGKIFLELERASLTKLLAQITESRGNIKEAASILQEIQVETLSTMETKDKVAYILEQMRLTIDSNDFVRTQILSKKINTKVLLDDGMQELKIRFYRLMVVLHTHEKEYIEIARSYQSIYNTPIADNAESLTQYMKLAIIYGILSPHSNDQHDLINRFFQDKNIRDLPRYKNLLKLFLTLEIISWPTLEAEYGETFRADAPEFASDPSLVTNLRLRVIQHNIRVISGYYERITSERFAQLLDLPLKDAELQLSDLVSEKKLYAKIDRPKGLIFFSSPKDPNDVLNDWSSNVKELLSLIEKSCHLIHREMIVNSTK